MSVAALNWAFAQRLPQTEKSVLVALAHRHHTKTGLCNPSVKTLIEMTGISERTIQRALRSLKSRGILEPVGGTKGGRNKSTKWRLVGLKGCQSAALSGGVKGVNTTDFSKTQKGVTVAPDREVYTKGGLDSAGCEVFSAPQIVRKKSNQRDLAEKGSVSFERSAQEPPLRLVVGGAA